MPDRAALIEKQIPGLCRFARALLHGDREAADDLVQDTLERALSHWNLRRNQGNLRGWLYTILYNRFLSDQHRVRRQSPHEVVTQETELSGIIDGAQNSVLEYRDLLRAFATLSEEQRAVLLLVGVEDLSYQEAARILGVPIGTVMSRLSRGRERLRRSTHGEFDGNSRHSSAALQRVKLSQ